MHGGDDFRERVNNALGEIFAGREQDFSLDENSMIRIAFEGDVDVTLQAIGEIRKVLIWGQVVRVFGDQASMFGKALSLNLFRLAPSGAFLAFDPEEAALVLCHAVGPGALEDDFGLLLGGFVVGVAEARRALLSAHEPCVETPFQNALDGVILRI